jgi:hypothetical protein
MCMCLCMCLRLCLSAFVGVGVGVGEGVCVCVCVCLSVCRRVQFLQVSRKHVSRLIHSPQFLGIALAAAFRRMAASF